MEAQTSLSHKINMNTLLVDYVMSASLMNTREKIVVCAILAVVTSEYYQPPKQPVDDKDLRTDPSLAGELLYPHPWEHLFLSLKHSFSLSLLP